ncbi:coproporphyrinogen dehydrogenase HemZ [Acidaminobacter sp. JC074]|uniref:coproporphyrinogen dehydrogenase HemZ n=1 Tax=Acidaminobacter sp. JC074 TaxID=2530199 RepID=UPI001F102CBF|nr:coproporphyrinogen dehydrogenase HemZ [Acidaminobacter sp. JC074]MCH4888299.1 coproporphyrinogen dehydrogenase HemZ [Acidaminobacter sp. JC074]
MKVKINHEFHYEVEHLLKTFVDKVDFVDDDEELLNTIIEEEDAFRVEATIKEITYSELSAKDKRAVKRSNSRVLYDLMSKITGKVNHYGTLVGVRPVKLVHEMLEKQMSDQEISEKLYMNHRISEKKRALLLEIGKREAPYLADVYDDSLVSLYICIPFCPTRCLYCSFPSNDMRKKGSLVESYLECLHKEIDHAYENLIKYGKKVDCIYIGGGTPSILRDDQFETLLSKLDKYFDTSSLKEFTIEAGRPDTITADKLQVFKDHHVSRICINPQTMNQKTLGLIGRDHSVDSINSVYEVASGFDFRSINMDLILGLPDEDLEDVKKTIDSVLDLSPTNITIHTLAVKTSSRLKETLDKYNMTQSELVEAMLEYTEETVRKAGYVPYYMYRQKNMVGNFENVGYCKPGYESLYNIRIIEEKHNILALGAGAVSKRCFPREDRFQRIANIKGIEAYIERIDDVIKKGHTFFEM